MERTLSNQGGQIGALRRQIVESKALTFKGESFPQNKIFHLLKCLLNEAHLFSYGNTKLDNFLAHLQRIHTQFLRAGVLIDLHDIPPHALPGSQLTVIDARMRWAREFFRIIEARSTSSAPSIQYLYQTMQEQRKYMQTVILLWQSYVMSIAQNS